MRQVKLYLDSNVWIQYLWIKKVSFNKEFSKDNKDVERSYLFVESLNDKSVTTVTSLFIDAEISGYFRDYLRFKKSLALGFDYTNSHKYKQQFRLQVIEKDEINSYLENIADIDNVELVKLKGLDAKSLEFFRIATCEFELDYMDTMHLIVAMSEGCKYFVTGDKIFKNKGNMLLKNQGLIEEIRIINLKEAKNLLN